MRSVPTPSPPPLRRSGLPGSLAHLPASIPELLAARAADATADFVIGPDFRLTFGQADERSLALAARMLAAGVGKGTRVALLFPNDAEWVVAWLAITRIGALSVPLSTFSPGAELGRALHHTDVQVLLCAPSFGGHDLTLRLEDSLPGLSESSPQLELPTAPFLRWIHVTGETPPSWSRRLPAPTSLELVRAAQREVVPADDLVIISTSGSTAAPKAVVHTQGSLVRHAALLAEERAFTPKDRIYSPMPFFWVGGLTMVLLAAMTSGAAAVVQERFEPGEALMLAEREHVTRISCWPNAARAMAEHPTFPSRDLSSVRGGTLVEALPLEFRPPSPDRAPIPLGMTETGGPHTGMHDAYAPLPAELRGTFGRSVAGVEHRVADPDTGVEIDGDAGELLVRGPFVMDRLYKHERHDAFTPDGWYATGDLGWFDADGNLYFTGRRAAMIKTGGSNVSPAEVEAALLQLDGVQAAFVFGVPAGDRGEDVVAVVAPTTAANLDTEVLLTGARTMLSSYKVPRRCSVIAEPDLPMLPTGKIDMAALRSLFADGAE